MQWPWCARVLLSFSTRHAGYKANLAAAGESDGRLEARLAQSTSSFSALSLDNAVAAMPRLQVPHLGNYHVFMSMFVCGWPVVLQAALIACCPAPPHPSCKPEQLAVTDELVVQMSMVCSMQHARVSLLEVVA